MLVTKQMKYFIIPLEHVWKVPILQELLITRMNNLNVEGFDDNVTTEMINMWCNVFFFIYVPSFLGLRSIISWFKYHSRFI